MLKKHKVFVHLALGSGGFVEDSFIDEDMSTADWDVIIPISYKVEFQNDSNPQICKEVFIGDIKRG